MKRIHWIELFAEIRTNAVSLVSIELFVCLGIGLFCGIEWCGVALCNEAQRAFEQGNMHDLELQFPYGITEEDMRQVESVEGVSATEPSYLSYQRVHKGAESYVFRFLSTTQRITVPTVVEGVLPKKANEVAILDYWAEEHDLSVGDVIELEHDAIIETDKDGMARLTSDKYTITALVDSPACLSKVSGTLGASGIGSGEVDCVAFVPAGAFDKDLFGDGYPLVYVRCDGLDGINTFSEEYKEASDPIVHAVSELKVAKKELNDAQAAVEDVKELDWVVLSRRENGGVQYVGSLVSTMGDVRWAMALIFVVLGLLVCYSAVSRMVYNEVTQIGTKRALGFRKREIAIPYLGLSTIAVVVGAVLSILVAVFIVQGIMNPAAADSLTFDHLPPYVYLKGVFYVRGVELVLILVSAWFAISGLLKRSAVDLINNAPTSRAKTRAWEKTKMWQKMPMFSQIVVNNLVNDRRRVAATLIGVLGCTGLIVAAITLSGNVSLSIERQYEEVYGFDTFVYANTNIPNAMDSVRDVLEDKDIASAPIHKEMLQVRRPDGYRTATALMVPTDAEEFNKLYHLISTSDGTVKDARDLGDDIWVSAAYANHMGLGVGDEVEVIEGNGRTHTFTIGGVFECYVIRHEFVLSPEAYRDAFGRDAEPDAFMASRKSYDIDRLREDLRDVAGFDAIVDDQAVCTYGFKKIAGVLNAVVIIYLALSFVMAIVVLYNLDKVFVLEKKTELIVLRICGFSVGQAKAYIYNDSIVLTIIGIALGVLFGAIMGGLTVRTLEPFSGHFVNEVNVFAVVVGIVGAAVLSAIMLVLALREISKLDLTELNHV